jgi:CDP-paratose 2-epimerase
MKILITGGCGFVGTNIALYLNTKGFNVSSLDNLSRKGSSCNFSLLKKKKIVNYKFDISNYNYIKKLPKFDLIIDCCAEASVEISRKDLDRVFNTNLIGTLNILKKVKNDNSLIIFLSSSRVYSINELNKNYKIGKKQKKLIDINFPKSKPRSIYGFTKLASEMLIEEFSYAFNIKYIINRCGVISGPLQFGKQDQGFVSLWVSSYISKKNLSYIGYNGSGKQMRDVLHIVDLCKLILLQIKNFKKINNLIFNVGGSNYSSTNLKGLSKICEEITGNKIKFKKVKKTSIYDIPWYCSDNSKVSKAYNWKPEKNIKDIVNDVYKWLKTNKNLLKEYF